MSAAADRRGQRLAAAAPRCCHRRIDSPEPNAPLLPRVPAGLDLSGSIVVLTHPRTGSSLLMQTLRLLGADVCGEAERPGLPADANPRGYYEHVPVLIHGLRAAVLADNPTLLRGRAFKLSLAPLVGRADPEEWRFLRQPGVTLLLPIRSPTESLRSQQVLLLQPKEQARRSLHHLASVRQHVLAYSALARWVTAPDFSRPPPAVVDYPLALADPAAYADRIARAAGLHPSDAQRAAAAANVDRTLHRFTTARVQSEQSSSRAEILEEVYQLLRRDEPDTWPRLQLLLPAWAHEATHWLAPAAVAPPHG